MELKKLLDEIRRVKHIIKSNKKLGYHVIQWEYQLDGIKETVEADLKGFEERLVVLEAQYKDKLFNKDVVYAKIDLIKALIIERQQIKEELK